MLKKPNIQEKINSQKPKLIKRLIEDFKVPFVDIEIAKNSINSFKGIAYLYISDQLKIVVGYSYSNDVFQWNINFINSEINSLWDSIYLQSKDEIDNSILKLLQIEQDEIKEISHGNKNIIYVYKKDNPKTPIAFQCDYIEGNWKIEKKLKPI